MQNGGIVVLVQHDLPSRTELVDHDVFFEGIFVVQPAAFVEGSEVAVREEFSAVAP